MLPENKPERLAFNLQLYLGKDNPEQRLAADLTALVLETAQAPENRITPFTWVQTGENQLTCPDFGETDIAQVLRWETRSDVLESRATLVIRDYILAQDELPFIIIWISPPDLELGYPEGRMVVGIGQEQNGQKIVENYGLCLDFSQKTWLSLGNYVLSHSENQNPTPFESIDQLRSKPLFLKPPAEDEPLDYLARLIPLPKIWQRIQSGEAQALRDKAFAEAQKVAQETVALLPKTANGSKLIALGARAEQLMIKAGWQMRSGSGCGLLNSEALAANSFEFAFGHFSLDNQGELTLKNSEKGVFVRQCPFCQKTINRVIKPGYRCSCGQVFSGRCRHDH